MTARILVAGVGNIFLGDDGFGVEVARRLGQEPMPDGVRVADFGIRGVHLAYELMDGYDALILVDAVSSGDAPGVVSVIEPEVGPATSGDRVPAMVDAHSMDPETVLSLVAEHGGQVGRTLVVGCQPAVVEERMGLSELMAGAVDRAVDVVRRLVDQLGAPNTGAPRSTIGR